MHRISYKFRLYPTVGQARLLTEQLSEACRLYNAALSERRDAWRLRRERVGLYSQSAQIKDIRAAGDIGLPNFGSALNVLHRVDLAFRAFFRRVKAGQRPGYPRWRATRRYDSITFEFGDGAKLLPTSHVRIHGLGHLRVKFHREPSGKLKTATIKREGRRWYAILVAEHLPVALQASSAEVGLDVGLTSFVALSDGTTVDNPRHRAGIQAKVRRLSRRVARRRRGSARRLEAIRTLREAHGRAARQRADFQHKLSRGLVNGYGLLAVEALNVKGLCRGMLSKSVSDVSWGSFLAMLSYKAEWAGRTYVEVDPRGTSQRCPCGAPVPKTLGNRWHHCEACGLDVARDHASALEILRLGSSLRPLSEAS